MFRPPIFIILAVDLEFMQHVAYNFPDKNLFFTNVKKITTLSIVHGNATLIHVIHLHFYSF